MAEPLSSRPFHWRNAASRLLLVYGVFFVIWGAVLVGLIFWEIQHYMQQRNALQLTQQVSYLRTLDPDHMMVALNDYAILESTNYNVWGLFDPHGQWLEGGVTHLPPGVAIDGPPTHLRTEQIVDEHSAPPADQLAVIAAHVSDGNVLVLAHTTHITARVGYIISHAIWYGFSFTLVPGLIGGLILNRGPRRRIRQMESAMQPIMQGDLRQRLPVGRHGDELDSLAAIVNSMLDQIEALMGEVKGVCDNIAHDLRTPLTRLRSQLYRVEQQMGERDPHAALLSRCVADVDEVLQRFRALLRISELEDRRRREGFVEVDLGDTLARVHELYAPLAEDSQLAFALVITPGLRVQADPDLLFEAVGNLVANAIKFTPIGGHVRLGAKALDDGTALIEVADSGPGIPAEQQQSVWQRFYRGDSVRHAGGHGLGLSIVAAIAKLHDFELSIDSSGQGTCMGMRCRRVAQGHDPA